jgi:hypothetical protein
MSSARDNKLARQIGEHLVCAELGRGGLLATPFAGNVPTFDVLAANERGRTVAIQVKASRGDSWQTSADEWMKIQLDGKKQKYLGPAELKTPDLVWVCVAIGSPGGRDRFFVMTEREIQQVCIACYATWMENIGWERPRNPSSLDCRWRISDIEQFENKWDVIHERLKQ